jgi:hypothetical protein
VALDLTSVNAKLGRAQEHFETVTNEVRTWLDPCPYRLVQQINADCTRYSFMLKVVKEPPLQHWSLVIADCINNLRCALDHFVYAIAIHEAKGVIPPPNGGSLYFPICSSSKEFESDRVQRRIRTLSATVRTEIKAMQPYNRPHKVFPSLLSILQDLDNANKHRLLRLAFATFGQGKASFTLPDAGPGPICDMFVRYGELKDGAEVHSLVFKRPTPDVDYKLTADLILALWHGKRDPASPPWAERTEFSPLIKLIVREVRFVMHSICAKVK